MEYLQTIKIAILVFPLVAFLFTIPFILSQYHRYGSINKLRVLIIYSFILYLMIIYFLVILPLPSRQDVLLMPDKKPNFQLFQFITDIVKESSFRYYDVSTYLKALKDPCIYTVIFNIFMTVPFGMYLHYYFKCSLGKTVSYSFLLSLFFELTQLTGLYFIYPKAYRLFDVDDLLMNTLGGVVGYYLMNLFKPLLPSREKIDEDSMIKGMNVSALRRITLFFLDNCIVGILITFGNLVYRSKWLSLGIFLVYYVLVPLINKNRTIGSKFLNIEFAASKYLIVKLFLRAILPYLYFLGLPFLVSIIVMMISSYINEFTIKFILIVFLILGWLYFYLKTFINFFKTKKMVYDRLSKVDLVSTISLKNSK